VPLAAAEAALSSPAGRLRLDAGAAEALLRAPLRCHRCGGAQADMPRLRAHIAACAAPLPEAHARPSAAAGGVLLGDGDSGDSGDSGGGGAA
jgi:hypothetical protein